MSRRSAGLTDDDIRRVLEFDWSHSDIEDEEDEEQLPEDLIEETLDEMVSSGNNIETNLIEKLMTEDRLDTETVDNTVETIEKLDIKRLKWIKSQMTSVDTIWKCSVSNNITEIKKPVEYFNQFMDDEIIEHICSETNRYALQEFGFELKCTNDEIRRYIGVLLYFGVLKIPQIRMAWSKHLNLTAVTQSLSRNRFEKLKECFHLNDKANQKKPNEASYDKLYKVRPLLDNLKKKCNELPQEEHQSIDEQIIPYKGRQCLKQYLPNKPHKWGFKMFTRAGVSGLIYDFTLYTGEGTCPDYGLGLSSNIILYLSSKVPKNQNYKIFFDNWFSSLSLLKALKEMGICAAGTIRNNRLGNCNLESETKLKKRGRGAFDMQVETNHNICVLRWYDNKCVQLTSNFIGADPIGTCKRWSAKEKKVLEISRPAIVETYNKSMGGVDLCDMLIELYRINHKSKKWYMKIAHWCFNVSVVNGWILYRNDLKVAQPGLKHMPLIQFQLEVANDLLDSHPHSTPYRKRGRPMKAEFDSSNPPSPASSCSSATSSKRHCTPDPFASSRYDKKEHWVQWAGKGRCRLCKTGTPLSICSKCKVHLCCNTAKNCFVSYHT